MARVIEFTFRRISQASKVDSVTPRGKVLEFPVAVQKSA
jgi:hypothetical protein